jgi:hypothetical protein
MAYVASLAQAASEHCTVELRKLSREVNEDILRELGTHFGVVSRVTLPVSREGRAGHVGYGFIEFATPADAQYFMEVWRRTPGGLRLYGEPVIIQSKAPMAPGAAGVDGAIGMGSDERLTADIGAKIVVWPVDRHTDIAVLERHFSNFGPVVGVPKVEPAAAVVAVTATATSSAAAGRAALAGACAATVSFGSFEHADRAIAATDGKLLMGKPVQAEYAMKPDGTRHGSEAERAMYAPGAAADLLNRPPADAAAPSSWAEGLNPFAASA